jgi:hypothetical protein
MSTQPLREMSVWYVPGGRQKPVHKADSLTAIWASCLENFGASKSNNPMALHGLFRINDYPKSSTESVSIIKDW